MREAGWQRRLLACNNEEVPPPPPLPPPSECNENAYPRKVCQRGFKMCNGNVRECGGSIGTAWPTGSRAAQRTVSGSENKQQSSWQLVAVYTGGQ